MFAPLGIIRRATCEAGLVFAWIQGRKVAKNRSHSQRHPMDFSENTWPDEFGTLFFEVPQIEKIP